MRKEEANKMLEDIGKNNNKIPNNNKTILLITDNIQHYQQQFNKSLSENTSSLICYPSTDKM